jgi:hypothetical protein
LQNLRAKVEFKRNGKKIITPAVLYNAPLPDTIKLESYRFVFATNVKCDVEYKIVQNEEVKCQNCLKEQPAEQQIHIKWNCGDVSEGPCQLLMSFFFESEDGEEQKDKSDSTYEFYHKPELKIR